MSAFDYAEMTTRNRGFVPEVEQATLRAATVFIPGSAAWGVRPSWRCYARALDIS